ncbi:hypothetical protein [Maridesulfovibrio frigidus]|uniref:hypothetical protein n=1 Tax=Maridesulfovibrio frigidus TaxID=340956 RepID=UPI000AB8003A|nr:hypothetical protein [Maridesulfovibrio frigidus]
MSDSTDEQYPEVAYCDDCFELMMKNEEDSGIVGEVNYEDHHGDECQRCGKTVEEERAEQEGK